MTRDSLSPTRYTFPWRMFLPSRLPNSLYTCARVCACVHVCVHVHASMPFACVRVCRSKYLTETHWYMGFYQCTCPVRVRDVALQMRRSSHCRFYQQFHKNNVSTFKLNCRAGFTHWDHGVVVNGIGIDGWHTVLKGQLRSVQEDVVQWDRTEIRSMKYSSSYKESNEWHWDCQTFLNSIHMWVHLQ